MENTIIINGEEYVKKSEAQTNAINTDGLPYVIIRTYSAGVHMGFLNKRESTLAGIEVELLNSRRIYSWVGAMTLSQLAMEGSKKIDDCKITMPVNSIDLVAIEIIPTSGTAFENLNSAKEWKV